MRARHRLAQPAGMRCDRSRQQAFEASCIPGGPMTATNSNSSKIDLEKFRLRTFVDRLIDMGEVEIHDEPVPLTGLGEMIERTQKAVLFKSAGPERTEIVAKTAASRARLIAAFETTEEKIYDEYFKRLANPKPVVEIPSDDAPVHAVKITGKDVDLTKLPFYPHHAYDGSCYMSSATDYTIDPATGRRNNRVVGRRAHEAAAVVGMMRVERQLGEIDVLAGDLDGVHRRVVRRDFHHRFRIGEPLEILVVDFFLSGFERRDQTRTARRGLGDDLRPFRACTLEQHRLLGPLDHLAEAGQRHRFVMNLDLAHVYQPVDEGPQPEFLQIDLG